MGINLMDYYKEGEEILTEEDVEKILLAAGYTKIENNSKEAGLYKDCNGKVLKEGDVFLYQFGKPSQYEGTIKVIDDKYYICWSDNGDLDLLSTFWFAPHDEELTKIIGTIYDKKD